ncbi:MAG TPA: hypothetical protein VG737_08240, partial [Cyclobacteriaceae bacterium]|nr:hypothetical protein [Cyclobacteriaceae bacterium]
YSKDGGNNFHQTRITGTPFIPGAENRVNPFTGISAHAGTIAITWTQIDEDKASVWTAIVKEGDLSPK